MSVTCQCGRPVNGTTLCSACVADLRGLLEQIPDLVAELDVTLTRQARLGDRNGPRSTDKPLPYDPRASEAGWVLRNTLVGWVRVIVEDMAIPGPTAGIPAPNGASGYPRQGADIQTPQIASWLLGQVHHLGQHVAGDEALEEIRSAVAQVRKIIDQPANRARIPIGPCPEDDCAGHIVAYIPHQADRPARMDCGQGHTWDTIHWRSIGRRVLAGRGAA